MPGPRESTLKDPPTSDFCPLPAVLHLCCSGTMMPMGASQKDNRAQEGAQNGSWITEGWGNGFLGSKTILYQLPLSRGIFLLFILPLCRTPSKAQNILNVPSLRKRKISFKHPVPPPVHLYFQKILPDAVSTSPLFNQHRILCILYCFKSVIQASILFVASSASFDITSISSCEHSL